MFHWKNSHKLLIQPSSADILIEQDFAIPYYQYGSFYFNTTKDFMEIRVHISVALGEVDFMVMNELSYQIYLSGYGPGTYLDEEDVTGGYFKVELGRAGKYYVVVENRDSQTAYGAVSVSIITPQNYWWIAGSVTGVVVVIGSSILVNIFVQRRKLK